MKFQAVLLATLVAFAFTAPVHDYEMDPECLDDAPLVEPEYEGAAPAFEDEGQIMFLDGDNFVDETDDCEDFEEAEEPAVVEPAYQPIDEFKASDDECEDEESFDAGFQEEDSFIVVAPAEDQNVVEEVFDDCEEVEAEPVQDYDGGRADQDSFYDFAMKEEQEFISNPDIFDEKDAEDVEDCLEY